MTKKQVRIVAELSGISEENLVIGIYPAKLVIIAMDEKTEYCEIFNIPDNPIPIHGKNHIQMDYWK